MKLSRLKSGIALPWLLVSAGMLFFSPFSWESVLVTSALFAFFLWERLSRLKTVLCFALVAGFLAYSGLSGVKSPVFFSKDGDGHYANLAKNMLDHKLYVSYVPEEKLMQLMDPYDPNARQGAGIVWDCSYYFGHYYLYWGIAPVVTAMFPVYYLTHQFPHELTLCIWFTCLSVLFGYLLILDLIVAVQAKPLNSFQRCFTAFLFVVGVPYAQVLRQSHIYELAIFSGSAYSMMALYLFSRAVRFSSKLWAGVCFLGSGIAFGLAIGSRPPCLFILPILLFMFFKSSYRKQIKIPSFFLLGFLPILTLLLTYNYLRFENPFEFGFHYQTNQIKMTAWGFNLKDEIYAVCAFLFQWPAWKNTFPFTVVQRFGETWLSYRHRYMNDDVLGVIFAIPFVVLLYFDRKKIRVNSKARALWLWIFIACLLMGLDAIAGLNIRYEIDFVPFFAIAAIVWAMVEARATQSFLKRTFIFFLFLYCIQFGFFTGFSVKLGEFNDAKPGELALAKGWFGGKAAVAKEASLRSSPHYDLIFGDRCYKPGDQILNLISRHSFSSYFPGNRVVKPAEKHK